MIRCPQCGSDNEENYNFCKLCGERLAIYKFCPECGKKNVEYANFCENCGTSLEIIGSGKETQYKEKSDLKVHISGEDPDKIVSLNLTPAESLIILNYLDNENYIYKIKDLLKMTFIDLIFKNVFKLDVREVEKNGILGTKIVKKTYLEEGKNFNMPLKPHEEVFRQHLPRNVDSKRFKKLQQRVAQHSNDYAKKKLLEPLTSEGYFNVEKKFLGKKYSLSDKGIETGKIMLKLKEEGQNLENWIETNPERAKAYLLMGGSNIFLTDDYYFEWFKNNSRKISKLFMGVAAAGVAYKFSNIRWYGAFRRHSHGIDFDDFDSFDNNFDDSFSDIFSDVNTFDTFDSMGFSDFDSGFDSGGFDGGGGDGGGGE